MKRIVSLLLALVMCFALVACGETKQEPAPETTTPEQTETTKEWPRMTIGGADSTGTMYAAAAAIATTITNAVDGMTIDATTSSGSNENALNVHNGDVELGMCTGDAALNAYNGVGKFADVEDCTAVIQAAKVMTGVGLLVGSLMWALVPEVITEAEYRTGNRPAAIVNALAGVAFKAGFSVAGWITPLVMGLVGFNLASEKSALPTDPDAWFTVTCIFALAGFVLLTLCFLGCKERISTTPEKPVSFGQMFKEFKENKCLQLVLLIFIVVFLATFINAPVNAYYPKLKEYQPDQQEAILWFTCVIPALLLLVVGYLIYKYPLTDERLDEMSKSIEERTK